MKTRTSKIFMDDCGAFLGRGEGCLIVRDRNGKVEKYPLFEDEIGEVCLRNGNSVSVAALQTLAFWGIDTLITTSRGNPVAVVKSLKDDSHVKTRISQYEATKNGKGTEIAKQIVLGKVQGQNSILKKYGFRQLDLMHIREKVAGTSSRNSLMTIEGHAAEFYFNQIFQLMPKAVSIKERKTFKAYDGINNVFNLCYTILKWKVYRAIIRAKLEPYLGFLHSEQFGKTSLVCDLMELYRYFVDDFIIQYCKSIGKKDFFMQNEDYSNNRKGQRQYLKKDLTKDMMKKLNAYFESIVEVPRIKHGNRQTIETLINEEATLLASYIRNERHTWVPRIASPDNFGKINHTAAKPRSKAV
jgi:CRISPR-associated protein Cas1